MDRYIQHVWAGILKRTTDLIKNCHPGKRKGCDVKCLCVGSLKPQCASRHSHIYSYTHTHTVNTIVHTYPHMWPLHGLTYYVTTLDSTPRLPSALTARLSVAVNHMADWEKAIGRFLGASLWAAALRLGLLCPRQLSINVLAVCLSVYYKSVWNTVRDLLQLIAFYKHKKKSMFLFLETQPCLKAYHVLISFSFLQLLCTLPWLDYTWQLMTLQYSQTLHISVLMLKAMDQKLQPFKKTRRFRPEKESSYLLMLSWIELHQTSINLHVWSSSLVTTRKISVALPSQKQ